MRRAEAADAEDDSDMDIPDELARRKDRLAAIKKAKVEIEKRAQERFEAEQAEWNLGVYGMEYEVDVRTDK